MNVGDRVSDYEIVQVLGAGGMGEVFKVRNVLSGRIEAMKILHSNLAGDKELADRFLREIRVQAALDHPHIARLHTAQVINSQLVMIMEFVDGESLAQKLQRGPLNLADTIQDASQVLDALSYAHEQGVVHRDIKPANIMCTKDGVIKLMDFGIARMKADNKLTETGKTVGSLHYMSPEQIRGTEPDPRSDIYSFGITLYEMITGKRPFDGPSNYSIMSAHLQQAPAPPVNLAAGIPPTLSEIILMSIAKDPLQRFQTAKAFAGALQSVQAGMAAPMPPPVRTAPVQPMQQTPMPQAPMPQAMRQEPMTQALPQPAAPKRNRGLYMVLGSIATVLVLAAGAYEVPKFLHVGANTPPAKPVVSEPVTTTAPAANPASPASPATEPTPAVATDSPKPAPDNPIRPSAVPEAIPAKPAPAQTAQTTPRPIIPQPQPAPTEPAQTRQVPASATPPPVAAPNPMNELREQYNELSIRMSAAKTGLDSMSQQLAHQGLGLRRDIVEAQTRAEYQMKEAMDSIRAGDAAAAREHLQYASGNLQTIDKFLGH
jgi:serine/threonine-protein kinase